MISGPFFITTLSIKSIVWDFCLMSMNFDVIFVSYFLVFLPIFWESAVLLNKNKHEMMIRDLAKILKIVVFCSIFLAFLSKITYAEDYSSFNRNVKNYNQELRILRKNGKNVAKYMVAIADNQQKRNYGLMNLEHLDNEKGMLFLFKKHAIIAMWMKNTLIPLDMLFISGDEIVWIAQNTRPMSLDHIVPDVRADKVLEINAGQVKEKGIKIGDKIKL